MIINGHFIFIHVPKTGGHWIRQVLHFAHPLRPQVERDLHTPLNQVPVKYHKRPALAFVRNPWDWYVSRWHYEKKAIAGGQKKWTAPKSRWSPEQTRFAEAMQSFESSLAPELSFSAELERLLSHPHIPLTTKRLEDGLARGLIDFCHQIGAPLGAPHISYMNRLPPANRNPHPPYQEFYTPELRAHVAQQDRKIIKRFGYTFEPCS